MAEMLISFIQILKCTDDTSYYLIISINLFIIKRKLSFTSIHS